MLVQDGEDPSVTLHVELGAVTLGREEGYLSPEQVVAVHKVTPAGHCSRW